MTTKMTFTQKIRNERAALIEKQKQEMEALVKKHEEELRALELNHIERKNKIKQRKLNKKLAGVLFFAGQFWVNGVAQKDVTSVIMDWKKKIESSEKSKPLPCGRCYNFCFGHPTWYSKKVYELKMKQDKAQAETMAKINGTNPIDEMMKATMQKVARK